jgi:hypothetical protein
MEFYQILIFSSTLLFLISYGFYILSTSIESNSYERPFAMQTKFYDIKYIIAGYILPIFGYCTVFDLKWYYLFLINIPIAYLIAPFINSIFFRRQSISFQVKLAAVSFFIGLISLISGYVIYYVNILSEIL